jgi:hypothetical protein
MQELVKEMIAMRLLSITVADPPDVHGIRDSSFFQECRSQPVIEHKPNPLQ